MSYDPPIGHGATPRWLGTFMPDYGGGVVMGWSANTRDWFFPWGTTGTLYTPPSGIVRDAEPVWDAVNKRFLLFYTLVISSTNCTHFGIAESKDFRHWTHVADVATGSYVTFFGPSPYVDLSGELHVFVAASTLAANNPGLLADFRLVKLTPTMSWDVGGSWSASSELTMPNTNAGYNEVHVFNTDNRDGAGSSGIRMAVNTFGSAGSNVRVFRPSNPADLSAEWLLVAEMTVESDQQEGVFVLPIVNGFRMFTTYGSPPAYGRNDYDRLWANPTGMVRLNTPPGITMQNGAAITLTAAQQAEFAAILG